MSDILIALGFTAVIVGGAMWGIDAMQSRSCTIYTEETAIETKWRHFDECYLKTPTGWKPWSEFKVRAVTNESTN